jgi:hypothetical protein
MSSTAKILALATVVLIGFAGCDSASQKGANKPVPQPLSNLTASEPPSRAAEGDLTPQEVFEKRIMPIFKSPNPSSCTQCHLANVDLKNYILPSHEKTFLSLRDQGLINIDKPEESKILKLITMREPDKKGADLIHEKMRQAEYEAFAEWIKASCRDPQLRAAPQLKPDQLAQPPRPPEVIRHGRKDRLLTSFEKTIWAERFRCTHCHMPGEAENLKLVAEHGERMNWIKREGAEATLNYLVASRLVNSKQPERSLLLRKPLMDGLEHGGGKKMLPGDGGYKAFRTWLDDYGATVGDKYRRAADLPKEVVRPMPFNSEIWLQFAKTPPAWGDRLLVVAVYRWESRTKAWEPEPIAVSDRQVLDEFQLWQNSLTLLAAEGSGRAGRWERGKPSLPPGRYLLKVFVDVERRLRRDWQDDLGEKEFVGQTAIETNWPAGYGAMTVIDVDRLQR